MQIGDKVYYYVSETDTIYQANIDSIYDKNKIEHATITVNAEVDIDGAIMCNNHQHLWMPTEKLFSTPLAAYTSHIFIINAQIKEICNKIQTLIDLVHFPLINDMSNENNKRAYIIRVKEICGINIENTL